MYVSSFKVRGVGSSMSVWQNPRYLRAVFAKHYEPFERRTPDLLMQVFSFLQQNSRF